jgi:hypothetical protein
MADQLISSDHVLGELMIDIRPEEKKAQLPKKRALDAGSFTLGGCEVVLATT